MVLNSNKLYINYTILYSRCESNSAKYNLKKNSLTKIIIGPVVKYMLTLLGDEYLNPIERIFFIYKKQKITKEKLKTKSLIQLHDGD